MPPYSWRHGRKGWRLHDEEATLGDLWDDFKSVAPVAGATLEEILKLRDEAVKATDPPGLIYMVQERGGVWIVPEL